MKNGEWKTMRVHYGIVALALILGACTPEEPTTAETETHEVHWGYEGDEGPERWADLSPEFAACRSGTEQSPIDLSGAAAIDAQELERRVGETVLSATQHATVMDIIDNGHTIQITADTPMSIAVEGIPYELVQYHFHSPSEHTINGEHAPLEVHFVHKSAAGELAVLSVLVEEGAYDVMWEPLFSQLPDGPGDSRHIRDLDLDIDEIGPLPKRFFRYTGSLTTPPCSEGVRWVVMAEKRQISADQMATIVAHLHNNNRPVQPLGDRTIGLVSGDD
jgi:carbonic anhydrase